MAMTPFDPSLDVRRRLTDLHRGKVNGSTLTVRSKSNSWGWTAPNCWSCSRRSHLSNLRRRMEMTLVKTPLTVPESVLKRLGVREVREQFAQQFVSLTREERLLWLNSFLFFMTADLRQLDDKIAKVRSYRSLGQTRNFLLGGESGMGKTTYLDWLLFNHLPSR